MMKDRIVQLLASRCFASEKISGYGILKETIST